MMDTPKVAIGRLWRRTSAKGNEYFVGVMGPTRLLLFKDDKDDSEAWLLYVAEREGSSMTNPRAFRAADATPEAGRAPPPSGTTVGYRSPRHSNGGGGAASSYRQQKRRVPADGTAPIPFDDPLDLD
jgi:hypothetical protein